MKNTLLSILCVVTAVALLAPLMARGLIARAQEACEAGHADPGLCHVAEVSGLFATPSATPQAAGGDAEIAP